MYPTTEQTLIEAAARPAARRLHAAVEHLAMALGCEAGGWRYIREERQYIEQAIAELQATQAELDPPVAETD